MKRRLRAIFLLLTLCILGINGFQAYWLYTTWRLTTEEFGRTVREALFSVVREQQVADAQRLVGQAGKPGRGLVVREFVREGGGRERIVMMNRDTTGPDGIATTLLAVEKTVRQQVPSRRPRASVADSLAHSISRIVVADWSANRRVSLPALAVAYHRELQLHGADAAFQLDTLTLRLRPLTPRRAGATFRFTDFAADSPPTTGAGVQTPPVPLNPVRDLFVRATFAPPTFYVLRQVGGLLAGSVGLLGLTTGCFLLMLTTILRQKKLADIKNDFINNMTHELKTPLATVSAAVDALQHFGALHDPQKTQTYLNISRQELQRLSDLVDQVLQMATEERRELKLEIQDVRPAELLHDLIARQQLRADKPVHFDVDVAATDSVPADPLHLTNVLNNPLDNAIKYAGERVTVTIRARAEPTGWRLTVADDGPGIPRQFQAEIFDRFFRVPTGNLHPVKGFGLGLYYARQVTERHGGTLTVRSEPGRGSEFTLWLPAGSR